MTTAADITTAAPADDIRQLETEYKRCQRRLRDARHDAANERRAYQRAWAANAAKRFAAELDDLGQRISAAYAAR